MNVSLTKLPNTGFDEPYGIPGIEIPSDWIFKPFTKIFVIWSETTAKSVTYKTLNYCLINLFYI